MSRRGRVWVIVAGVLGAVLVVMAALLPVPFVTQAPGPVFDVLGDFEGKPVLQVSGTRSYPTSGQLDMTTVAEQGGSNGPIETAVAIAGLLSRDTSVVPDEGASPGDNQVQLAVFDASKSDALGAAATYLDRPVKVAVVIVSVTPGSGSDGRLQAGDTIVSIDGKPVRRAEETGSIVQAQPVGTRFDVVVQRQGRRVEQTVRSGPSPNDPQQPVIGVVVADHYTSDFDVKVNLAQIGGPSAGLMLALGMVDKLTPGDLLAGRHVAGTGTITGSGRVGPIGGIDKKMIAARAAGAQLFIAPSGNCEDTAGVVPEGLTVAPVASLGDAVTVVEDWRKGEALPTCPADGSRSDG